MTFAVWFTALLAVFTFSSCLDSENGGTRTGAEIVRVSGYMGTYTFESAHGYELIPTNMSALTMDINTQYAYVTYGYDSGLVTEGMKKIQVELYGILPIKQQDVRGSLEGMKEFANAPIQNITAGGSYTYFPISFWNPNTMFLPINYFIKDYADQKDIQKEVSSHDFEICYDLNDEDAYDGSLLLHVRHHVGDPALNKERFKPNTTIFHVDLSRILNNYKEAKGGLPDKIVVEYEENSTALYDEHSVYPRKVEVDYQTILDAYNKK